MSGMWPRKGIWRIGDGWFVPSRSKTGVFYRVEWHHHPKTGTVFTCTCPAGQVRGQMGTRSDQSPFCRHVLAVGEAERDDGAVKPEPVKPNIGALCD
jgi:SWIM zinc finger